MYTQAGTYTQSGTNKHVIKGFATILKKQQMPTGRKVATTTFSVLSNEEASRIYATELDIIINPIQRVTVHIPPWEKCCGLRPLVSPLTGSERLRLKRYLEG